MERVIIIGAGGHGQVVADILLRQQEAGAPLQPVGYLDDAATRHGQHLLGLPVLGSVADLPMIDHEAVIIAIGDNATRRTLFEVLRQRGERFAIARHPSAVLAPDVRVGPGTVICAGAIVNPGSSIGANVIINTGCTVDHHNQIGDHAHLAPGVHLGGDVQIGAGTLVGIGSTIMPQRRIGAWSVVGAGTLVHRDVPDRVVLAGVPGRIIKQLE
ncbi:acetyltransferase [Kallotenue papyrolyticum]|uniref:acetyltransferase n=1 Tax=Kallotenue papyrolyticum TaxID=1325125 RepID=UPI0004926B00|nr:acetyltransferase [Kallotenue papyrolyticum]